MQKTEKATAPVSADEKTKPEEKGYDNPSGEGSWTSALGDNEAPMLLAGLYEDEAAASLRTSKAEAGFYADCSATILTMESKGTPMEKIHSR